MAVDSGQKEGMYSWTDAVADRTDLLLIHTKIRETLPGIPLGMTLETLLLELSPRLLYISF